MRAPANILPPMSEMCRLHITTVSFITNLKKLKHTHACISQLPATSLTFRILKPVAHQCGEGGDDLDLAHLPRWLASFSSDSHDMYRNHAHTIGGALTCPWKQKPTIILGPLADNLARTYTGYSRTNDPR